MCSILGYYNTKLKNNEIEYLNNSLSHRGPDNSTCRSYIFKDNELFLCHNRLAIQDLDIKANQPMENGQFVIVFNGEVYNHLEIRKTLNNNNFLTHSDTETLLWAFTEKGLSAVNEFIGMFSIGLYDKKNKELYLIRDRVGIKPLYWTFQNNEFAFSSELKGFSSHLKNKTNDKALIQFMSLGYIPNKNSYYDEIYKLEAGSILTFDGVKISLNKYWELPKNKQEITFDDALFQTEMLIKSSINYRLLADVDVGCFLSGGIDSSLVSSIMQKESSSKIKTFSIGFENKEFDESIYAKQIANYLNTEHYEYKFSAKDVLKLLDNFDIYYDEPFGDASSLPMMLLSKVTKEHVTVALSGDGGDELFYGYERYFTTEKYYNYFSKMPTFARTLLSFLFKNSKNDKLEKVSYPLKNLTMVNLYSVLNTSIKPWEIDSIFNKEYVREVYKDTPDFLQLQNIDIPFKTIDDFSKLDFLRYLPDDILTKVDRASMAYSLEARVPLLDHRIVEFAYSLPKDVKLQKGKKSILKELLYKYVPKELVDRPKAGFSVPLQEWFRNELKDVMIEKIATLDERFDKKQIMKIMNLHLYHNRNYEYVLWNLMRVK